MNGWICLLLFGMLAVTALAAVGLCRRLFSHELPEHMATLVLLEDPAKWEQQSAALAAQIVWTDRDMVRTVWLVDATPEHSLAQVCETFCRRHRDFHCCHLSEAAKIFGSFSESEKNHCNLSKKQV